MSFSSVKSFISQFLKLSKDLIKTPHCEKSDVLYLVKTARTNFGLRQLLRSNRPKLSKSAIQNDKNGIIKTQMLFLIGFDSKETMKEKKIIENEIQEFGDFIIGDYFDAYQNLTKKVSFYNNNGTLIIVKTFSAHRYVNDHCGDVQNVLIRDDDTLINENDLKQLVSGGIKPMRPYCLANVRHINSFVIRKNSILSFFKPRDLLAKYAQTTDEYPLSIFPPYCGGACALFSADYLRIIYATARHTNPGIFLHDDVFFTGILRTKANLNLPENIYGVCQYFNGESSISSIKAMIANGT